jgi:hypothetical protein
VWVISTIHDTTIVNTGKKEKNKHGNTEACCCPVHYIHERCRRGRTVPQLLLSPKDNGTVLKQRGYVSAKLCAIQYSFLCTGH